MNPVPPTSHAADSREANLPFCSVVIPTHNRARELRRALASVAVLDYPTFETIVVDNSPGDERVLRIAKDFGVRVFVEPRIGVSFARNCGAAEARGEIIAFLDDDAVAEPGWLRALVAEFEDPIVMGASGPYQPLGPAIYQELYNPGGKRRTIDLSTPSWFESAAFDFPARGGNMAIRANALLSWTGFVPELGRGAALSANVTGCGSEDSYATVELVKRGYRFVYTPDAVVRHPLPRSHAELRALHFKHLTERGQYIGFLLTRGYARAVLKHLACKIGGDRQRNSHDVRDPFPLKISAARELIAGLRGMWMFTRAELLRKARLSSGQAPSAETTVQGRDIRQ